MVAPDQLRPRDQPTCLAPRHRPAVAICPLEACAPGIGVHPCAPHFAPLNHQWQRRLLAADSGLLAIGLAGLRDMFSPAAIYMAPAINAATPAIRIAPDSGVAAATPMMSEDTETIRQITRAAVIQFLD